MARWIFRKGRSESGSGSGTAPASDSDAERVGLDDRHIRVFVSSTFRDMQAERDLLVKSVFPELRKLCDSRGITWSEVDLRWGITDEEAAEGKVLPICLEEISRCRPFFIGLLGERYGWTAHSFSPELIEREPWLQEYTQTGKSTTELEILHGVLNKDESALNAFFYFRDPGYIERLPAGTPKEDFVSEDAASKVKLEALKRRIRVSGWPVCENFADAQALGALVKADLTAVIDRICPPGSPLEPLGQEARDHSAYARSRRRVYIARAEYFAKLDAHASSTVNLPLAILGDSGSGKSALLANWIAQYRQRHSAHVLEHYIGASPYSADCAVMLRRLMGELKQRLGLELEIPDDADALRLQFPNWLQSAAEKGRVVIAIDALNQLDDREGASDLDWLPAVLPDNIRMIVSTLPGRALEAVRRRGWPTLTVELLTPRECVQLIEQVLQTYRRSLNRDRVERIAAAPQCANPLFLRVLLDELRVFGVHELLDQRIDYYLTPHNPEELYGRVIERWQRDYGEKLVGQSLKIIWAARHGVSQAELLDLLGKNEQPLPRAYWTPFYLAAEQNFTEASGLLTFSHNYLRQAVERQLLPSEAEQRAAHERLASYFAIRTNAAAEPKWTNAYARGLTELAYHLRAARDWDWLTRVLTDWGYLDAAIQQAAGQAVSREYAASAGAMLGDAAHGSIADCAAVALVERYVASINLSDSTLSFGSSDDINAALVDLQDTVERAADHGVAVGALGAGAVALCGTLPKEAERLWGLACDRCSRVEDADESCLANTVLAIASSALKKPEASNYAERAVSQLGRIDHSYTRWREAGRGGVLLMASGSALSNVGQRMLAIIQAPVSRLEIERSFSVAFMRYGADGAGAQAKQMQDKVQIEMNARLASLNNALNEFTPRARWPALAISIARELSQDNIIALVLELVRAIGRTMGEDGKLLQQSAGNAMTDGEPGLDGISRRHVRAELKKPLAETLDELKDVKLEEWTGTIFHDATNSLFLAAVQLAAVAAVDRASAQQLVELPVFGDDVIKGVRLVPTLLPRANSLDDYLRLARFLFSQLEPNYKPELEHLDADKAYYLRGMIGFARALMRDDAGGALDIGRRFRFFRNEVLATLARVISRRGESERRELYLQAIGAIAQSSPYEAEGLLAMLCLGDELSSSDAFSSRFKSGIVALDEFRDRSSAV